MRKKGAEDPHMRVVIVSIAIAVMAASGQTPGRGGVPSISVRTDSHTIRGTVAGLMGWRVGLAASAFGQLTFSDAAAKVDAAGLAFIVGSSEQKVSAEIPKNLDYNLSADEIGKVRTRLAELRLHMAAYRAASLPADTDGRRKLFEFARSLGVETILAAPDAATLPEFDRLANEFGVNVAVDNAKAIGGFGKRIGLRADSSQPVAPIHDRLLAVNLREHDPRKLSQFLLALAKLDPPGAPAWPPKCTNCAAPTVPAKPLILTLDDVSVETFEKSVLPATGYRVDEISRKTPITSIDGVPADERTKIEAALPRQALVKPKKARKLLVVDICPNGGYYHATIAHANLALELMGKQTGAYTPTFSNDLDNLKYPKIKQYDAVFLNSVVGEVFNDPEVLGGLTRFVREGGGLAGIHGSTYASMDLPEFGELIGAVDGPHQVETATLKIDDPDSPLTRQFKGQGFQRIDEFYHFLPTGPFSREKLHVLISIDTAKSDMTRWKGVRPDGDYGSTWIKSYGKGRVFNCAMGHTPTLFADPAMAQHILAGVQFVLGDLEADTTPSAKLTRK
jgi:hypothetical protein